MRLSIIVLHQEKKIKILGKGNIKTKLDAEVNFISKPAKEKIEKLGGKITLIK